MLRVGVTGGIGSGKTALTDWLATQGVTIVDADLAARSVVRPGQPALLEIAAEFGKEYLDSEGGLDRAALRALVFTPAITSVKKSWQGALATPHVALFGDA